MAGRRACWAVLSVASLVMLASCSERAATAELRVVQSRAQALTGGDVVLTQAWKTAGGELCGTFVADTPEGRDYGAFEAAGERIVVATEFTTGFAAITDECVQRRGTLDVDALRG